MNQFYASPDQINDTYIWLEGQEANHAAKVLRKGVGDTIIITDGIGTRYKGKIESIAKNRVSVELSEAIRFRKPNPARVLALGMIKKRDRLEFAVEKATELGISEIILFRGDHSESFKIRMDRVEAAVLSAMKQSLRVYLPSVKITESVDALLAQNKKETVILHADQQGKSTGYTLTDVERVLMVVGPEGGLSERERALLKQAGAEDLRLGDYRLRAETAAMVMASRFGNSDVRI
ncbi:RsmE family RNA methyltransferase [soil metagenome]